MILVKNSWKNPKKNIFFWQSKKSTFIFEIFSRKSWKKQFLLISGVSKKSER